MQQLLIASVLFLISSLYVLLLANLAISPFALQKAVVFLLIFFFIIAYFSSMFSLKKMFTSNAKWVLLFLFTIIIQVLILSTGGLQSPFLILIHLLMVGLSFLFSFSTALIFLLASFTVILINLISHNMLFSLLQEDPTSTILQISSLISIIPVAYIVSQHYHFKDTLLKKFHTEALTAQSILKNLNELIIITDTDLNILSVNDAVLKMIHKSRSELLNANIFDVLMLKNTDGKLLKKETLLTDNFEKQKQFTGNFTLIKTAITPHNVILNAQIIDEPENAGQISFVITLNNQAQLSEDSILDRALAKHEALFSNIKKGIAAQQLKALVTEIILLEKFHNDIIYFHSLKTPISPNIARIDVASFCRQLVVLNQDFATALHVPIDFALRNFGEKDVAPLVSKSFFVKPEAMTGPFFTVECDVKQVEFAIKKLFDIAILLASHEEQPQVIINVERGINEDIVIEIATRAALLDKDGLHDLFVPYYGKLGAETGLSSGSGLEGYLAKTIINNLGIKLIIDQNKSTSTLFFKIAIPKKAH